MNVRVVNPIQHSVNKVLFALETFHFNGACFGAFLKFHRNCLRYNNLVKYINGL